MRIDYEAVLQDFKKHLQTKDSHGRRELLTKIGELEADHGIKEGTTERALRVAGNRLSEELLRYGREPDSPAAAGVGANGTESHPVEEPQ